MNKSRIGQGKKIDQRVQEIIVETLVSLWLSGKRKRDEISAEAILEQISFATPDLADRLPSPQTVRKVTKPIKAKLTEEPGDQDQPWSLGLRNLGHCDIDAEAVPLLLQISKFMATDVSEERQRKGFALNRLSIREAKWISILKKGMLSVRAKGKGSLPTTSEAKAILDMAAKYSRRELIAEILGEHLDTYDLDMQIAYGVPMTFWGGGQENLQQWMLSLEMNLIPQSPRSQPAEILENAFLYGPEDVSEDLVRWNIGDRSEGSAALIGRILLRTVSVLEGHGIRVCVPFGSSDWRETNPLYDINSFETFSDYELTEDILRLVLPLARIGKEASENDQIQVRIATAFLLKAIDAARNKMQDPEVLEIIGTPPIST